MRSLQKEVADLRAQLRLQSPAAVAEGMKTQGAKPNATKAAKPNATKAPQPVLTLCSFPFKTSDQTREPTPTYLDTAVDCAEDD
mmetsp:Transcript_69213/g.115055  ORF Transcript_69213/g.115055 Transcript_69213/m.115055 type:complete len:84 (+) Transcript_69213:98-349(+)